MKAGKKTAKQSGSIHLWWKSKPAEKPKKGTWKKNIIPRLNSKQSQWNNVMKTSYELTASARQMGDS
jgi:hypothetical protein